MDKKNKLCYCPKCQGVFVDLAGKDCPSCEGYNGVYEPKEDIRLRIVRL